MDSTAQPSHLLLATESLRHADFEASEADCGEAGLRACQENDFDLLLLDVMMPGVDGYTVCATLRRDARAERLPIVMLTGLNDSDSIERAYAAGAQLLCEIAERLQASVRAADLEQTLHPRAAACAAHALAAAGRRRRRRYRCGDRSERRRRSAGNPAVN